MAWVTHFEFDHLDHLAGQKHPLGNGHPYVKIEDRRLCVWHSNSESVKATSVEVQDYRTHSCTVSRSENVVRL